MNAILATIGTDGDVYPYVGLGALLRSRGHRVTLAAAEPYRSVAADWGLEFAPLISDEENRRGLDDPDFWHPIKGPWVAAKWGVGLLDQQYEIVRNLSSPVDSVLIASPAIVTARLINEQFGRPLATLILQPWMIPSTAAPPIMPGGLTLPRWAPSPVAAVYWRMFDAMGDLLVGRHLNRLRERLNLTPVRRLFRWWLSPQLVLGMFPDWYGPPQRDWPPQIRLAGFPRFDAHPDCRLSETVARFCREGQAPVAFTFGTGMSRPDRLFRSAVEACRISNRRGILVTRYPQSLPADLPASILHCQYAPFRALFPLCAAVVHHGGIGTVAEGLAAGTPQLILPIAFDQLDNATRVRRLGAGDFLRAGRATGPRIARALSSIATAPRGDRGPNATDRSDPPNGLEIAAEHVERIALSASGGSRE